MLVFANIDVCEGEGQRMAVCSSRSQTGSRLIISTHAFSNTLRIAGTRISLTTGCLSIKKFSQVRLMVRVVEAVMDVEEQKEEVSRRPIVSTVCSDLICFRVEQPGNNRRGCTPDELCLN